MHLIDDIKRRLHRDIVAYSVLHGCVLNLYLNGEQYFFFFFKQKTAYEITASDWSSDVCSSDLHVDDLGAFDHDVRALHREDRVRADRKSVVKGKSVRCCVDLGGRRIIKKKTTLPARWAVTNTNSPAVTPQVSRI